MVIEKVHGLHATNLSLNERFTMLAAIAPDRPPMRPRRRPSMNYMNPNFNLKNRNLIGQIARRLEMQAKRQAVKQRLGMLRRFGSESSLPGLRRANSFGNLSQYGVNNRISWRQSNGNLSRSASFSNLSTGSWRGFRRRGGHRAQRGRFRYIPGGVQRSLNQKPVVSKEQLDLQLDQYMAGTKAALDKELDTYMKNAMDME